MGFFRTHLFGTVVTAACRSCNSCREKERFSTWLDENFSLESHPCLGKKIVPPSQQACFNLKKKISGKLLRSYFFTVNCKGCCCDDSDADFTFPTVWSGKRIDF